MVYTYKNRKHVQSFLLILMLTIASSNSWSQGLLIYEGFDYALQTNPSTFSFSNSFTSDVSTLNGGQGFSGTWLRADGGTSTSWPSNSGFRINDQNTRAFAFNGLSASGTYLTAGINRGGSDPGEPLNRIIDLAYGNIKNYTVSSSAFGPVIGRPGTTLFLSFVMGKGHQWEDSEITLSLYNGSSPDNSNHRMVEFGYFQSSSSSGNPIKIDIKSGSSTSGASNTTTVPLFQPALLVLRMDFGVTAHTFTGFVNPDATGSVIPSSPSVGPFVYAHNTSTVGFSRIAFQMGRDGTIDAGGGWGPSVAWGSGIIDEIRVASNYAEVLGLPGPIPLSNIVISGASNTISTQNGSIELSASAFPTTASSPINFSWAISNSLVATLSGTSGSVVSVTGLLDGTVTVTGTATNSANSVSSQYIINLSNQTPLVSLTGITINGASTISTPAGTLILNATPIPSNSSSPILYTWSISNSTKASLSGTSGSEVTITGIIDGVVSVTCQATNAGGSASSSKTIIISGQPTPPLFSFASEVPTIYSKVGDFRLNQHVYGSDAGFTVAGVYYPKGLAFATDNAATAATFAINGGYKKFTAIAVNQADCGGGTKVGISILVDGEEVYSNNTISVSNSDNIDIDLIGANTMEIKVNGVDGPCADWGALVDAKLFILYPAEQASISPVGNVTSILGNGSVTSFTGMVVPSYADQQITWTAASSASITASINSESGELTIENNENGTITVTGAAFFPSSIVGTYVLNIVQVPITATGLTIQGAASGNVNVNETAMLSVTYTPAATNQLGVNWSSSNTSVATVNNGTVTGLANGTVTITATYGLNASVSATKVLSVIVPVTGITVSGTNALLVEGTTTLTGTISPLAPTNSALTWSSSAPSIASVNASTGAVSALAVGVVTITATSVSNPSVSGSFVLSVNPILVSSISLSGTNVVAGLGTAVVNASVLPANATNKALTWASSANAIATVSGSGVVRGLSFGTVTITATSVSTPSVSTTFVITFNEIPVASVSVSGTNRVNVGSSISLIATVLPSNASNKAVTWTSSDIAIATVSGIGQVRGLANGIVTITAASVSNTALMAMYVVTVGNPVVVITQPTVSLSASASEITTSKGTLQITASVTGSALTEVSYSLSDTLLASIDATGLLTAKANGVVVVTAALTSNATVTGTLSVTISGQELANVADISTAVSIYPNPAKEVLNIAGVSDVLLLELYDVLGQVVVSKSNTAGLSLSGLQAGSYVLKVVTKEGVAFKKVAKE